MKPKRRHKTSPRTKQPTRVSLQSYQHCYFSLHNTYIIAHTPKRRMEKELLNQNVDASESTWNQTPRKSSSISNSQLQSKWSSSFSVFWQSMHQKGSTNKGNFLKSRSNEFRWRIKTCQKYNLTLFGILILHDLSKTNLLRRDWSNKYKKKDLQQKPLSGSRLQTRTSLLSSLESNSPIKVGRDKPQLFPYQSTTDKSQTEEKKELPNQTRKLEIKQCLKEDKW